MTHMRDKLILIRKQIHTEVISPWEGYNGYDDVSNDSCSHVIKDATFV